MSDFQIKDSGDRIQFESGMVRDTEDDKVDYTYMLAGPMLDRYCVHLEKGAVKYGKENWLLADDQAALDRYERSLFRHVIQYLRGDRSEDHASAIIFNVNGAEYVRDRLEG